ncbi:MAG TPA: HXXEE domain-containing protein [Gemmatimonadaceae bacterium]|nr:HXXEE domain-containing protein [Gemmatimonadaceae bacterium]
MACSALALHVADEASHDFLAWYNPIVRRIRHGLGGFPFPPTFTFWPWLIGLAIAVLLLLSITPPAFRHEAWVRPLAILLGLVNAGNGILHLVASAVAGRRVPGVLSAPFLLASGLWLLYTTAGWH